MALVEINWHPSCRQLRQFAGIWFPAFFALIGALILYHSASLTVPALLWSVALVVSLVGLLRPSFIRPIYLTWMWAVYPLGWTISHLMLAVVFFGVITPVGVLLRLLGHDSMQRQLDRSAKSYWVPHNPAADPARYFRQI